MAAWSNVAQAEHAAFNFKRSLKCIQVIYENETKKKRIDTKNTKAKTKTSKTILIIINKINYI